VGITTHNEEQMSKLTFRAADDLIARVEELDASKSEVMREALREYLGEETPTPESREGSLDAVLTRRVDELIEERLGTQRAPARDLNVNVTVDGAATSTEMSDSAATVTPESSPDQPTSSDGAGRSPGHDSDEAQCGQCGETIDGTHVYCPNCGEKRSRRVFCECGDELRTDWSFCPGCGRRTPAADVLDSS
jgi:Arc/MetJ-type ribon-helix-helix transcriptional regulator